MAQSQRTPDQVRPPEEGDDRAPVKTTGKTVVVACKMPHGFKMRRFILRDIVIPSAAGMQPTREAQEVGERIVIRGNAIPVMRDPGVSYPRIESGFALTYGVPADAWAEWLEQNKDQPYIRNGLVFAYETDDAVVSEARNRRTLKSGLEPIQPKVSPTDKEDPRMPRPLTRNVTALQTAEEA